MSPAWKPFRFSPIIPVWWICLPSALRPADECNIILQLRKGSCYPSRTAIINSRFHPFIEISVPNAVPSKSLSASLPAILGIFQHKADFPAFKHILQMGYRGTGAGIKTLLIQSMRPPPSERSPCSLALDLIFWYLSAYLPPITRPFLFQCFSVPRLRIRGLDRVVIPCSPAKYPLSTIGHGALRQKDYIRFLLNLRRFLKRQPAREAVPDQGRTRRQSDHPPVPHDVPFLWPHRTVFFVGSKRGGRALPAQRFCCRGRTASRTSLHQSLPPGTPDKAAARPYCQQPPHGGQMFRITSALFYRVHIRMEISSVPPWAPHSPHLSP